MKKTALVPLRILFDLIYEKIYFFMMVQSLKCIGELLMDIKGKF